jgi:hypothetical protein
MSALALAAATRRGAGSPNANPLRRQCACGTHTIGGGTCASCGASKGRSGDAFVPAIVREVLSMPGEPLDSDTRALMESRVGPVQRTGVATAVGPAGDSFEQEARGVATGYSNRPQSGVSLRRQDFSAVRIHTGPKPAASTRAVDAWAYTAGHNIVFGNGQFAPHNADGRALLAHELTHVAQQRGAEPRIQRVSETITKVQKLLSYSATDWAITDSEAMEALALLEAIPADKLAAELKDLPGKYVDRLLDNLPDAAKTGPEYQRIITALGSKGSLSYAVDQLSYGFLDWAITDAEVTNVFNIFINLPPPEREEFFVKLDKAKRLGRLIDNSNSGHHALYIRPWIETLSQGSLTQQQRDILRVIVQNSDDDEVETIKLCTRKRFDVTVEKSSFTDVTPVEWDAKHLRQTYLTLDKLPESHVAKNKALLHLGSYDLPGQDTGAGDGSKVVTAGAYSPAKKELGINKEDSPDPEGTITHETGHSVDKAMGWSVGPEPAKPARGGWKNYGTSYHDCADAMLTDSGGGIKTRLTQPQRDDVIGDMESVMSNRKPDDLEKSIKAHPWFGSLKGGDKDAVMEDKALKAIPIAMDSAWRKADDGGEHLADHVYEEGYPNDWSRYRFEARTRMISNYQFRSIEEWFAEVYGAYYAPDERGKGAKLNDKDPDTKKYFDDVVDKLPATR